MSYKLTLGRNLSIVVPIHLLYLKPRSNGSKFKVEVINIQHWNPFINWTLEVKGVDIFSCHKSFITYRTVHLSHRPYSNVPYRPCGALDYPSVIVVEIQRVKISWLMSLKERLIT